MGHVIRVQFGRGYDWQPKTVAMTASPEVGATRPFTVGPESIFLAGGRVLHVPPRTQGANACVELMTDANKLAVTGFGPPYGLRDAVVRNYGPRNKICIVIAAVAAGDVVQRFAVLGDEDGLANVGALVAVRGESYLTSSGYRFRLDPHVQGACAPPKVAVSKLLRGSRPHQALVDPITGAIVKINCVNSA